MGKKDPKFGCAVISDNHFNIQRIPVGLSIFTAEVKTVDLAVDLIRTCDISNAFIIVYNSLSALKFNESMNQQIKKKYNIVTGF